MGAWRNPRDYVLVLLSLLFASLPRAQKVQDLPPPMPQMPTLPAPDLGPSRPAAPVLTRRPSFSVLPKPSCPQGFHGEAGPQWAGCVPDCPKGYHARSSNEPDICVKGKNSCITVSPVFRHSGLNTSGGEASLCDAKPVIAKQVAPLYPDKARQIQRPVTLEMLVLGHEDGTIEDRASIKCMWFEHAAEDALKQWRWKPFLLHGKPIAFRTAVYFRFESSPEGPRVQILLTKPKECEPCFLIIPPKAKEQVR